ncbi:polymeric immunoglobulin receptor-like [Heteronotia binoei]|uniref:polymeric immunoglobulin receptor-like n=1 Tax=Heteronotia binoei TaxID=13085 RepID=UPI00292DBAF4|nr:polymeric immunoglobulin receptor-like [Heteronotia binoei]
MVSQPSSQDLMVSQPSFAQGTEGGSVTLRCSYNSTSESKIGSYWWVKNPGLVVKSTSQEFMGRVNCTSDQGFLLEKRADIEIQHLRLDDSGMYQCVVSIHGLRETSGKGTELQVMKRDSGAQGLVVSQPRFAQGIEGGSVTLRCSYNSANEPKVGNYHWVKNQSLLVKNITPEFMGRVNGTSDQHFLLERRADIEIRHLKHNDSGMYLCVVGIHGLQETSGNGTELQVLDREDPPTLGNGPNLFNSEAAMASAFVVFAAGCLLFLYCKRTRAWASGQLQEMLLMLIDLNLEQQPMSSFGVKHDCHDLVWESVSVCIFLLHEYKRGLGPVLLSFSM